jgi:hypothetical protein
MAQSGFTPIQHYRSATASATPAAIDLEFGELAINYLDGNLFFKDSSNIVRLLASTAAATGTVSSVQASGGTTGLTFSGGPITTSGTLTLGGTLALTNGGTGATSAAAARTNLNVPTRTGGDASGTWGINVTGTSANVTGTVAVANGGTGATAAAGARTNLGAAASGAVTGSGLTMTTARILGRTTASTGAIEEITIGSGLSLSAGTLSSTAGGGTVTSVGGTGSVNGITLTGTVTTSGDLTLGGTLSGVSLTTQVTGTLPVANGGTGVTTSTGVGANVLSNGPSFNSIFITGPNQFSLGLEAATSSAETATSNLPVALLQNTNAAANNGVSLRFSIADTSGTLRTGGQISVRAESKTASSVTASMIFCTSNVVERMRLLDNGNFGIGTSTPSERLDVNGTAIVSRVTIRGSDANIDLGTGPRIGYIRALATDVQLVNEQNGAVQFWTNNTERVRVTSTGNVGIGTIAPGTRLEVRGVAGAAALRIQETGSFGVNWDIDVGTANYMNFKNNAGSPLAYVFSNGSVGIGLTNPAEALHVTGNILASGNITAFSDERLKEDITTVDKALDKVQHMRGVTYRRKDTGEFGVGVVAQEMLTVLPEVVNTNGEHMSVAYGNIVGVLIEAIKELSDEVSQLRARLED